MNTYDLGDRVKLTGTFRKPPTITYPDGELTTPTGVTCQLGPVGGPATLYTLSGAVPTNALVSTATITAVSAGVIEVEFTLVSGGGQLWAYRFVGTGAVEAAEEGQFRVRQGSF
jgi:hypothetical protein